MPSTHSKIVSCSDFSSDGLYRYSLTRTVMGEEHGKLLYVLLNPSRADALQNDVTVMNCQNIAFRAGPHQSDDPIGPFSAFRVCNLFARVGADVAKLRLLAKETLISEPNDPQRNDRTIRSACGWADDIVCGWGGELRNKSRRRAVIMILQGSGKPLWCLGTTTSGDPYHPTRGRENETLMRWCP